MSVQENKLIQAIRSAPAADEPRIEYAAWLARNQRPLRARFIMAQCTRNSLASDDPEYARLLEFESEMLTEGKRRLTSEERLGLDSPQRWTMYGSLSEFERGLPKTMFCRWPSWIGERAERLAIYAPTVEKLKLSYLHAELGAPILPLPTSTHPFMEKFTDLDLKVYDPSNYVKGARIRLYAVLDSKYLTNLSAFSFTDQPIAGDATPEFTRHMASCGERCFQKLKDLNLSNINMTAEALANITTSPVFRKLTHLDISGNPVGDEGARLIAESPALQNLRTINLKDCGMTAAGLSIVATLPRLVKLEGHEKQWFWTRNHINQLLSRHLQDSQRTTSCPRGKE